MDDHDISTPGGSDDCGCCAGLAGATPHRLYNRPGLPAIGYRVGRHADFRASMLARLSAADLPQLARLTTRDADDFTIALSDAAAAMLDVLGFYQERIANESFLRTASERMSILELSRLIGYRPAPGVAASCWLAFTLQEAPGLPGQALPPTPVPAGTRVQSVPGADEQPQTFETVETISARADWNALPVSTAAAWQPQAGDTDLYLEGLATGLQPGDALLIVGQERLRDPGSERWDVRVVAQVQPDPARGITRVSWLDGLGHQAKTVAPAQDGPRVYALRQRAALFGHNAPDPRLMGTIGTELDSLTEGAKAEKTWRNYQISSTVIDLDAAYPKITAGSWIALVSNKAGSGGASLPGYVELYRASAVAVVARTDFGLSARITRVTPDVTEHLDSAHYSIRGTLVLAHSELLATAARPLNFPVYGAAIALAGRQPALSPGQALAVSGKRQRIGIVAGAKGLQLVLDGGAKLPLAPGDALQMVGAPLKRVGGTSYPLSPEEFGKALGTTLALRLALADRDGTAGVLDAAANQVVLQPALEQDATLAEIVLLGAGAGSVVHGRDGTMLHPAKALRHVYDRATVRINANVAAATHGETVTETLGAGAAGKANQRFTLRQSPLTQVSAATPDGRASTLALRVNDLLWHEVPTLYGHGPAERVFTTELDDGARTTLVFGDGVEGARLPSGQDNIRGRYRKGLGAGGNVAAGQLGNLLTRPLGVAGVTNPEAASGGQDPEGTAAARANAPLTVLTMERAVSVQDYQDFSRSFAGIAKAHAGWIGAGPGRGIVITVAGDQGEPVEPSSDAYRHLLAALRRYGDALLPLRLATYRGARFRLRAALKPAPDADPAMVLMHARAALRDAYGFAVRQFGQQVSADEVMALLHRDSRVVAVNVIELYRPDQGAAPRLEPRLFARLPEPSLTQLPQAAELLLLDQAGPTLELLP